MRRIYRRASLRHSNELGPVLVRVLSSGLRGRREGCRIRCPRRRMAVASLHSVLLLRGAMVPTTWQCVRRWRRQARESGRRWRTRGERESEAARRGARFQGQRHRAGAGEGRKEQQLSQRMILRQVKNIKARQSSAPGRSETDSSKARCYWPGRGRRETGRRSAGKARLRTLAD